MSKSSDVRWKNLREDAATWPPNTKRCSRCEGIKGFEHFHKHSGCLFGLNNVCKSCRKPVGVEFRKNLSEEYKIVCGAKSRARKRGLEFNIDVDDICIQEECPVLGEPYEKYTDMAPSLDRIDNSKGYIVGNIIVMSLRANRMKGDYTMRELKSLIKFLEGIYI